MDPANSQQAEQSEGIEEYVDFVWKPWLRKTKLEFPMLLNIIIFHVNLIFLILLNNWSNFYDFFKKCERQFNAVFNRNIRE